MPIPRVRGTSTNPLYNINAVEQQIQNGFDLPVFYGENTGPIELEDIDTISYSTHREITQIRPLGRVGPAGFVQGKRTIAGSIIVKLRQGSELRKILGPYVIVISGIKIVDTAGTVSIDDTILEQQFSYIATDIRDMTGSVDLRNFTPDEDIDPIHDPSLEGEAYPNDLNRG
jgi:hypothetical protein